MIDTTGEYRAIGIDPGLSNGMAQMTDIQGSDFYWSGVFDRGDLYRHLHSSLDYVRQKNIPVAVAIEDYNPFLQFHNAQARHPLEVIGAVEQICQWRCVPFIRVQPSEKAAARQLSSWPPFACHYPMENIHERDAVAILWAALNRKVKDSGLDFC